MKKHIPPHTYAHGLSGSVGNLKYFAWKGMGIP
jgi:hypothetical protein